MKRIIITMLLIVLFTFNICFISRVYAANLCTVNANFSENTTNPGKDIVLTISTANINGGVSGVNVTLEYDESVLELVGVEKVDGWTIMQTENSFSMVTDSSEETATTGNIGKIKLRVLESAGETKTNVKLTSVQATRDGATMEQLDDISKELNIVKATNNSETDNNNNNSNTNNEKSNDINNNTSNDTSNGTSNSKNNSTDTNGANKTQSNAEDNNTIETKKAKTQNSKLPYTGSFAVGVGSVFVIAIIAVLSYMKYIKYKDVK